MRIIDTVAQQATSAAVDANPLNTATGARMTSLNLIRAVEKKARTWCRFREKALFREELLLEHCDLTIRKGS
jgi:hypothetical protein